MKKGFKVLGITALIGAVAALIPYKVKKDEETGETKAKALLWEGSHTPATELHEREITVNVRPDLSVLKKKAEEVEEKLNSEVELPAVEIETPVIEEDNPFFAAEPPVDAPEIPVVEAPDAPEAPIE